MYKTTNYRLLTTDHSSGMTFIELLVWVAMLSAILFAITSSILYFNRVNRYALQQATAIASAQKGIGKMVRAIREASYSSQGAYPIVSIGSNDFVFYANLDTGPLIEKVHYSLQGTTLQQGVTHATGDPLGYTTAEVTSTISDYVRNLSQNVTAFHYYDQAGAEITDYSKWTSTRFVKVNIIVDVDPYKLPNQVTLSSSAALRNLVIK